MQYPADIDLSRLSDISETKLYEGFGMGVDVQKVTHGGVETDQLIVNMGPHHPSTHGVFRMIMRLDGETVKDLEPIMGYLHRNHEKNWRTQYMATQYPLH